MKALTDDRTEQRCEVCGELVLTSGRCCSRNCRSRMAEFEEFYTLQFILGSARWAGAPSQEEQLREYLRDRMHRAVKQLAVTADNLAEVLIEISIMISDGIGEDCRFVEESEVYSGGPASAL